MSNHSNSVEANRTGLFVRPNPIIEAHDIISEAIELYQPCTMFGLFSGGHDSLVACHIASRFKLFAGCVHINTGIGVEETREYVRSTCKAFSWPLREMQSKISYESLVLKWGFPGPASHGVMYTQLKERCLRQLVRESKTGPRARVLLIGGARSQESTRRMGNAEPHCREGCRAWCSPIVYWSTDERNDYIDAAKLPKNRVVAKLCMSGECLCGAFAKPGEYLDISHHFPEVAQQIRDLEAKAKAAGVHCRWGERPPRKCSAPTGEPPLFSLCWSCGNKT